ncbi:MAG: hypothetical protein AB1625_14205 [Acidobacteriota bacterium]
MTIRDRLNARKKRVVYALGGCALIAVSTALVSVRHDVVFLFTLASVAAAIVIMYSAVLFGFRCPRCRGQWGYLAMYSGGACSIRKDLRFCPYCGVEIDRESGPGAPPLA